jgi:magnesium transporter
MNGQLLLANGSVVDGSPQSVSDAVAHGEPFWLDLCALDDEAVGCLRDVFKVHPLALSDAQKFGQRPKVDAYEGYDHIVIYGATESPADQSGLVEVHAFYCADYLVTIHREPLEVFDPVRTHAAVVRQHGEASGIFMLYRVLAALIDGFFPVLDRFDDTIDSMEDEILKNPTDDQLGVLFDMKRRLVAYRKVITPARDVFGQISAGAIELPGMTPDSERYFRDLYDHLIRISDLIDSYRDLLTGAVDTHLSVVSNRLNVVMKQLAVIATIFLPLSFLTGFFGQNFSVLVNHYLTPTWTFWVVGIGSEILAVIALYWLFKKRQWL